MTYELLPLTKDDKGLMETKINEYVNSVAPADPGAAEEEFVLKVRNEEEKIIGGLIADVYEWNWGRLFIEALWVDEPYRGQGIASMLIRGIERIAKEKGCYVSCLGTCDFQARGLYEKHGYTVFSVNKDRVKNHESYSMCKRLDRGTMDYIPANNKAEAKYKVEIGNDADADVIDRGLTAYCDLFAPETHENLHIGKKIVDKGGAFKAGIYAVVDGWDGCFVGAVYVEEKYRRQGLGTYLIREVEREAKKNGARMMLTYAGDWNVEFFKKNGYTLRGELKDFPRGHTSYELKKLL